jgi:hypothetical protein
MVDPCANEGLGTGGTGGTGKFQKKFLGALLHEFCVRKKFVNAPRVTRVNCKESNEQLMGYFAYSETISFKAAVQIPLRRSAICGEFGIELFRHLTRCGHPS